MLALTPLASAPLATAEAVGLPEISAQAAGALSFGGGAGARVAGRAQAGLAQAGLAQALLLGGQVKAYAVARGQGEADFEPLAAAGAQTAARARLQSDLRLAGDGEAKIRAHAAANDVLELRATARSAVGGHAAAALVLDLRREITADSAIDATSARGLPLMGGAVAELRVGGATMGAVAFGITAQGDPPVTSQGGGEFVVDGTAQAAAIAAGALAGGIEAVGRGALVSRVTGRAAGRVAIAPDVQANVSARAHAEMPLPWEGDGIAGVTAEGAGAIGLPVSHDSSGTAALSGAADGGVALRGQAISRGATAAQAGLATLSLTGRAAGTILAPRASAAAGMVQLTGQAQAKATLDALSQAAIGITGATQGASGTHVTVLGCFGVAPDLRGDGDLRGASIGQIGFSVAAAAWTASAGSASKSVVEVTGGGVARAKAVAECTVTMLLRGAADARLDAIATTTAAAIGWIIRTGATVSLRARGQGRLSVAGAAQARSQTTGTATADALKIDAASGAAAGVVAGLDTTFDLGGTAQAGTDAAAQATGQFTVTRDSDADVQVAGDAARVLPLTGAASGAIVTQAPADGAVALGGTSSARVQGAASLARGAALAVQAYVTGLARTQSISSGHVAFVRQGLGDVPVAAGAARGLALLGSVQARSITQAATNLSLAPQLASKATNVIRVEFAVWELGVAGRGIVQASILGIATDPDLDLGLTSSAFGAPPALRRSEPPRTGLSGRILPANSGRILRG